MWKVDSKLTYEDLGQDAVKNANLHAKYLEYYHKEKRKLRKLENMMLPKLYLDKKDFYMNGPNEDTPEDWKLPAKGKVFKQDIINIETYLNADPDLIKMKMGIGEQKAIVDALEEMLKAISNRKWEMKNAIDFLRITSGE